MRRLEVPLDAYRFGVELTDADPETNAAQAHGIDPDGALLVRPDGFVGWRTGTASEDPERTLERVLIHLLCRMPSAPQEVAR
jgi:putative polyketide hydroxylase